MSLETIAKGLQSVLTDVNKEIRNKILVAAHVRAQNEPDTMEKGRAIVIHAIDTGRTTAYKLAAATDLKESTIRHFLNGGGTDADKLGRMLTGCGYDLTINKGKSK